MSRFSHSRVRARLAWTASTVLALSLGSVAIGHAQTSSTPPLTLPLAFAQAWERQPEAAALLQRRQAGESLRQAASNWTPAPAALEASVRSDRFNRRQGAQELEFGVAVPLWLPGERERSQALADAHLDAVERQALLAQWQLAQSLREHWWGLLREREELRAAQERLQSTQALASDVARRVKAGELSRADQNQADAAVLLAVSDQAQAHTRVMASEQSMRALLGLPAEAALLMAPTPEPEPAGDAPAHPLLAALQAKAQTARSAAALAKAQVRASPELTLLHTRDRAARGEASNGTVTLGLRCWRRSKFDPPCRLNFDPGLGAGIA